MINYKITSRFLLFYDDQDHGHFLYFKTLFHIYSNGICTDNIYWVLFFTHFFLTYQMCDNRRASAQEERTLI